MDADKHSSRYGWSHVLAGECNISTYCWVLREHASVSSLGSNVQDWTAGHTAELRASVGGLVSA